MEYRKTNVWENVMCLFEIKLNMFLPWQKNVPVYVSSFNFIKKIS